MPILGHFSISSPKRLRVGLSDPRSVHTGNFYTHQRREAEQYRSSGVVSYGISGIVKTHDTKLLKHRRNWKDKETKEGFT